MDPMARAFSLGLERSHLFVGLFTQGLEGGGGGPRGGGGPPAGARRPPGGPGAAPRAAPGRGPPGAPAAAPAHRFFATGAAALAHLTHHEAHHTGCLSMLRRALGKDKVI
ncbi:MAG: hypothetical protein IPH09_00470 [bacterium]|nr:hypothetical protein [bacterium]